MIKRLLRTGTTVKSSLLLALFMGLALLMAACGSESTAVPVTTATSVSQATSTPVVAAQTTAGTGATTIATVTPQTTTRATGTAPTATATAQTAATTASGTPIPVPTVGVSDDARKSLEKIATEATKVRKLEFKTIVGTNFMTRDDLGKYQLDTFKRDNPPDLIDRATKSLVAFGFVKAGFDYTDTYVKLLTEQVLGFYETDSKKLFVITEDPSKGASPLVRFTAEHELTHALQDQNFNLDKVMPSRKAADKEWNDDRSLAQLGLIEGDAVQSQNLWLLGGYLSQSDIGNLLKETQSTSSSVFNSTPMIIRETLMFPYREGNAFVQKLYQQGGWEAVNKAWTEYPPVSSSQIINIDKYQKKIEPVKVDLSDLSATMGSGWQSVDINTMGEYQTGIWLKSKVDDSTASRASKGWAGDRYQILDNNGKLALVWRSTWDSENDAKEYADAAALTVPTVYGASGNGGSGATRTWQTSDKEIQLILKGKEVLLVMVPKGANAAAIVSKLGF